MKRIWLAAITASLVLGTVSLSEAVVSIQDPVHFWLYDGPTSGGDGITTLALSNFDFSGASARLQYSIDTTTNWLDAQPAVAIQGPQHLVFLRLLPNSGQPIISGDLNFMGQDGNYFNSATVLWSGYQDISIATAGSNDKLSPMEINASPAPIPAAAFLFGSGLAGLGLLRNKRKA